MSLGSTPLGTGSLAGVLARQQVAVGGGGGFEPEPPLVIDPFTVTINGISVKPLIDSLSIEIELGRQGTASFTLSGTAVNPLIGHPVSIQFYGDTLFNGSIDSTKVESNNTESFKTIYCECTDNSYLLFRRKIRKKYTNTSVSAIAQSLINEMLMENGVTLGVVDPMPIIPMVDADKVTVFDALKEVAASVGTIFYIDNDKKLNFVNSSISPAPMVIDENIVETASIANDRETYRNKQTIIVTGTPVADEAVVTVEVTLNNNDSYLAQSAVEGSAAIYDDIEEITHPTANDTITLTRLAYAYGRIRLGITGSLRDLLNVRTRQTGFQVGQLATVSIPHVSAFGSWVVQKLSMREESGRYLISTMDLAKSSLMRRSQELWLEVIQKGKVVILPPSAITTFSNTYATPGTYSFTVPAGVDTVIVEVYGGGGGGGGSARSTYPGYVNRQATGGKGGNGGLAVSVIPVTEGQELTLIVGTGGTAGSNSAQLGTGVAAVGVTGGAGQNSRVDLSGGFSVALGYGGEGGLRALAHAVTGLHSVGFPGQDGSGDGNVVTVGGAGNGGSGGYPSPSIDPVAGADGKITLRY